MKIKLPQLAADTRSTLQSLLQALSRVELPARPYIEVKARVYSTPGTFEWVRPRNLAYAEVTVVGGGGGAGYAKTINDAASSGGGSAGWTRKVFGVHTLRETEVVVVGAGGLGGVASSSTAATNGGNSSFGSLLIATRGTASASVTTTNPADAAEGNPGSGAGGDVSGNGARGEHAQTGICGGSGAPSIMGGGGPGNTSSDGGDAVSPGSGGGGTLRLGGVDRNGGKGAPGIVIVMEYYYL